MLKEYKVEADYIFFFSYIQASTPDKTLRVNSLLLSNFVGALKLAEITPKRFMLQTGELDHGSALCIIVTC